jgi:hypothetical protein
VCDGDSGSWVVHRAAPHLYGHVVATDALGDAYVLPAPDTFNNIRECLGAISVQLPNGSDFLVEKEVENSTTEQLPAVNPHIHDCLPKRWNPSFSTHRRYREDQPYFDFMNGINDGGSLESMNYLLPLDTESQTIHPLLPLLQEMNVSSVDLACASRKAWLDDRSSQYQSSRAYPDSLTAHQLYMLLRLRVCTSKCSLLCAAHKVICSDLMHRNHQTPKDD